MKVVMFGFCHVLINPKFFLSCKRLLFFLFNKTVNLTPFPIWKKREREREVREVGEHVSRLPAVLRMVPASWGPLSGGRMRQETMERQYSVTDLCMGVYGIQRKGPAQVRQGVKGSTHVISCPPLNTLTTIPSGSRSTVLSSA